MKEVLQKKTLFVVIPLLIALLSVFVLSSIVSYKNSGQMRAFTPTSHYLGYFCCNLLLYLL